MLRMPICNLSFLLLLLLFSFNCLFPFPFPWLIKQRPALTLHLAADNDGCVFHQQASLRACSFGGQPVASATAPNVRTLRLRKCMSLQSRHVHPMYQPFSSKGTPDSGPDPNAGRRICRRARSDPRRHAHDAAWKFSSSSHRAFDAVWHKLNRWAPPPAPRSGPSGCQGPSWDATPPAPSSGTSSRPLAPMMSPAIRSQGPRQPCFFPSLSKNGFCSYFFIVFSFPSPPPHVGITSVVLTSHKIK